MSLLVPTPAPPNLVTFTIKVNGEALPQTIQLVSANINFACNKVPFAKLRFLDGDAAEQTFEVSEDARFDPGAEIEISLGYQSDETPVFKGVIVKHGIKTASGKPTSVVVDCRHPAFKSTLDPKSKQYSESTDSDIFDEILGAYSLAGDIASTTHAHQAMMQWRATDWDFLLLRARANGLLLQPTLDAVDIQPPAYDGAAALALAFGSSIEEFEAEIDARRQIPALAAIAWDPAALDKISADGAADSEPDHGSASSDDLSGALSREEATRWHAANLPEAELQAWADARLARSRAAKVIGRARCQGFAAIGPGDLVELEGLGARFNGLAFVAAVTHEVNQGNWRTHLQFGLDPAWFERPQTSDTDQLLARSPGLHIGIVKQLQNDPLGEERILVTLPVTHPEGDGVWARLASPDAGNERGVIIRPEIGDEVVVAFFDNDPRYPVIIGSLYSSSHPSHLAPSDDNHEKGYQSREKLQLHFDDDKKNITLKTDSGNSLFLTTDEGAVVIEDENGNIVKLNADGILLESIADINIKATGDVNIEGVNINAKASAALTAEGSASATLKSGGQTEVKGSIVMIN